MSGDGCCGFGGTSFGGAGGVAPPGGVNAENEGTPVPDGPFNTLDFQGGGVVVLDGGGGTLSIRIPGITFLGNSGAIPGAPHDTVSLQGDGVDAADGGGGIAVYTIPGNVYAPPEQWFQEDVPANQLNVQIRTRVAASNTIKMMRAGWVVGLATRLTEAITNGLLRVNVTVNGVDALSLSHDAGTNPSGGIATQPPGLSPYAAGDELGIQVDTDAGFLPTTTDLEAWIQLFERP